MAEDKVGPSAPIVSVRPGRNRLPDEDRAMLEERRKRQAKGGEGDDAADGYGGAGGQGHDYFQDDISVMGIPKEEMTDAVRHAIGLLLDEINDLRAELARAKSHEAYLEEQAEKDRLLHVMRRRAFLARLGLASRRVADEQVQFSFIYIVVANAQRVRTDYGHGAVESLLVHVSEAVREALEPGDIVGSLENFDFGVILPATSPVQAVQKAQHLCAQLAGRPLNWHGQTLVVEPQFGIGEIAPGDQGDDVITRARRNREERQAGTP
ncbi:GGDEF domain-containing protein [Pseudomonadota bacterium]